MIKLRPDHHVATIALVPKQEDEEEIIDQEQFVQEEMTVEEQKKTIETVNLAPDEVEEEQEEKVTTDSLFDEE